METLFSDLNIAFRIPVTEASVKCLKESKTFYVRLCTFYTILGALAMETKLAKNDGEEKTNGVINDFTLNTDRMGTI